MTDQPRYRVAITRTTGHGRDREIRDIVSAEVPEQLVPELRTKLLNTLAGYSFPPQASETKPERTES